MALYVGQSEASMDEKGRLTIPKKFRKLMGVDESEKQVVVWVVPGGSDCDFVMMDDETGTAWARNLAAQAAGPNGKAAKRRLLLEMCERVEVDSAGRALIPASFLEARGVKDREFHIGGCGDHIAVYGKDKWAAHESLAELQPASDLWDEFGGVGRGVNKAEDQAQ